MYLGEIDIEEEGFLGVGDLDAILDAVILLVRRRLGDVHVVHCLRQTLHCFFYLRFSLSLLLICFAAKP